MADVPQDLVAGRIEQAVEGDGQLAGAQVGSEVAADLADHVDDPLTDLLREPLQVLVAQALEVVGTIDRVEQAGVFVLAHDCRV